MKCDVYRADANGLIQVRQAGCGFALVPAVPVKASNTDRKARPGNFPVSLNVLGGSTAQGNAVPVMNSSSVFVDGKFSMLELTDCDPNDAWQVFVFETRGEGMIPSSQKTRAAVRLQDSVAVPTAAPTLATDGFPLRPGQTCVTSYFGGTLTNNTLYVRQLSGTWFNTQETTGDLSVAGATLYDTRDIKVPGDRFAWVASAPAETVVVEMAAEVG